MKLKKLIPIFTGFAMLCSCNTPSLESTSSSSSSSYQSLWQETIWNHINQVFAHDIPYFDGANSYSSTIVVENEENILEIFCYFENEEDLSNAPDKYANLCESSGWSVEKVTNGYLDPDTLIQYTYDVYYADLQVSDTLGLEMQFLIGADSKGKDCFGIFGYTYTPFDGSKWPSDIIKSILGYDVPQLSAEGYTYQVEVDGEDIYIVIEHTTPEDETAYYNFLTSLGYIIDDTNYAQYGYVAYDENYTHVIQFWYDTQYFNAMQLLIYAL